MCAQSHPQWEIIMIGVSNQVSAFRLCDRTKSDVFALIRQKVTCAARAIQWTLFENKYEIGGNRTRSLPADWPNQSRSTKSVFVDFDRHVFTFCTFFNQWLGYYT